MSGVDYSFGEGEARLIIVSYHEASNAWGPARVDPEISGRTNILKIDSSKVGEKFISSFPKKSWTKCVMNIL